MKKLLLALLLTATPVLAHNHITPLNEPVVADKITKGLKSYDAMGCMLLRECTDNVKKIHSIRDLGNNYPDSNFNLIADEFNSMLVSLEQVGVNVFLADEKYFPPGHRGVYHTVSNNFFLNEDYMHNQGVLMSVMRHEGWHVAQDCMAGTINNSIIAIIKPEDSVPPMWAEIAKRTYMGSVLPWEREAMWAGHTEGMTADALKACATGAMWEVYPPTPLTRQFLEDKGYIK